MANATNIISRTQSAQVERIAKTDDACDRIQFPNGEATDWSQWRPKLHEARVEARQAAADWQTASIISHDQSVLKLELRRQLVDDHLSPLYDSAIAMRGEIPGIVEAFRPPRVGLREKAFVARIEGIAANARQHEARFLAHGSPVDFLEQLGGALDRYLAAANARRQSRIAMRDAKARIDVAIEKGLIAIKHLNAMVRRAFKYDTAVMTFWNSSIRADVVGTLRNVEAASGQSRPVGGNAEPAIEGKAIDSNAPGRGAGGESKAA